VNRHPELARRFFHRFEPVHAVTYFAPEARAALDGLGCRGFWMGYFAARSAPLGKVPAEVVTAVFYNFAPERVAKALSGAWAVTGPESALRARRESAAAVLRRYEIADEAAVRTAAELAGKAARHPGIDGRPLFAANRALSWPDDPVSALWHAVTLLREHRGDAHVAVLTAEGVSGRECNVLQVAAGKVPREYMMRARDYDEASWRAHESALAERGLLDDQGALTAAGAELKNHIEHTTDRRALVALDGLDDGEVETLFQALTPLTRRVVAAGDVPAMTPMGLRRDDLDNDSAAAR
jgi:helix-turn-helix protein